MKIKATYHLPRMDDYIDKLGDAEYFTIFDAFCGYWQMKIGEKDKPKTEFVSHAGTFQRTRISFELKNTPACF